jgi:hypothetical protein
VSAIGEIGRDRSGFGVRCGVRRGVEWRTERRSLWWSSFVDWEREIVMRIWEQVAGLMEIIVGRDGRGELK